MLGDLSYASLILPICVALPVWHWLRRRSRNTLPYPPGPKGYPLIGSVLDFPIGIPSWEGFTSMAKQYGTDVLYLNVTGMDIVVLSTSEAVVDLLDQRSVIYSDKPIIPMVELIGADQWSIASMRYGSRWRTHRKLFNEFFNISAVKKYDVNQVWAISDFLVHLHQRPEGFRGHIHHLTASLPLSIAYGIRADTTDNKFICLFEELLAGVKQTAVPGAFLVDVFILNMALQVRICPGRHFAISMLHLAIARTLAVFAILPPVDEGGRPRIPEAKFHDFFVRDPRPFDCVVKPRSEKAIELISNSTAIYR